MSARRSPFASQVASFEPKPKHQARRSAEDIDRTASFPVREAGAGAQGKVTLGINCTPDLKEEFRQLCKAERYNSADMLKILINEHKERQRR